MYISIQLSIIVACPRSGSKDYWQDGRRKNKQIHTVTANSKTFATETALGREPTPAALISFYSIHRQVFALLFLKKMQLTHAHAIMLSILLCSNYKI